ncbi:MAG: stage 0 sporulation protein [Clostridia bacterium]|nr:stage 0 sporulation protein [Clostridia bacterium]
MVTIIGVKYPTNRKTFYFDPKGQEFALGDHVIVETARGLEYGEVVIANKEVEEKEIKRELKPVVRKATQRDTEQAERLLSQRKEAMKIAAQKAEKFNLKLKFVDCIYTFDGKKVMLYFTADGRVDFRELVKELASALRARIELCQIYERDDIKMRGALAPCGRPCCCNAFLNDFEKVTIKMAKVQGLSLSPTKISGMCGKLMCCLKYESDYYAEVAKEMPKVKSKIQTPDGEGIVDTLDMLRREVVVRFLRDDAIEYKRYPVEALGLKPQPTAPEQEEDTEEMDEEEE